MSTLNEHASCFAKKLIWDSKSWMSGRQIFDHEKWKEFVTPMGKIKKFVIPLEKYSGLLENQLQIRYATHSSGIQNKPLLVNGSAQIGNGSSKWKFL